MADPLCGGGAISIEARPVWSRERRGEKCDMKEEQSREKDETETERKRETEQGEG